MKIRFEHLFYACIHFFVNQRNLAKKNAALIKTILYLREYNKRLKRFFLIVIFGQLRVSCPWIINLYPYSLIYATCQILSTSGLVSNKLWCVKPFDVIPFWKLRQHGSSPIIYGFLYFNNFRKRVLLLWHN